MFKKIISVLLAAATAVSCMTVFAETGTDSFTPDAVYNFGNIDADGAVTVPADTGYTASLGYGFLGLKNGYSLDPRIDGWTMTQGFDLELENGADGTGISNTWVATTVREVNGTSYRSPIRFAVKADTNSFYKVRINIRRADPSKEASVSLFTEKRHQHLLNEPVPAEGLSYTATVHVHNVWSKNTGNYEDTMLNVAADGENVAVTSIEVQKLDTGRTLWLLGDSTVCEQTADIPYFPLEHCQGVGSAMAKYLGEDWAIVNEAESGLSASAAKNHFANFVNDILPGDIVWFEFGHNDDKITNNPATNGYLTSLESYYNSVTAKGADFVVVAPIERDQSVQYYDGEWHATLAHYAEAGKAFVEEKIAAGADNIAFIDLNTRAVEFLNEVQAETESNGINYGYENTRFYYYVSRKVGYTKDYTHPNDYGADNFAAKFVDEVQNLIALSKGGTVEVDADAAAKLYRACYAEDGTLISVSEEDIALAQGTNSIRGESNAKTFVWSGADTMKPYVITPADSSIKAQAAVLAPLVEGARDKAPNKVPVEIMKAGAAPNSFYPESLAEVIMYPYPIVLNSISFDENGAPAAVDCTRVASEMTVGYAKAVVEIFDKDGSKKGEYVSDDVYDNVSSENQQLHFTAGDVVFDREAGDTFIVRAYEYDDIALVLTDTVVSTTITEDSLLDIKEILIDEDFSGYETTGAIIGTNGWLQQGGIYQVVDGVAQGRGDFLPYTDTDGSNYAKFTGMTANPFYAYRKFSAVSSGQLMVRFDLRYNGGALDFNLTDGTDPNKWQNYIAPLSVKTSSEGKVVLTLNGAEVCAVNKAAWTTVRLIIDLDYGKYYLTVAGTTYTADAAPFMTTGVPSPAALGCISMINNQKTTADCDIANLLVASLNTAELPSYNVTLSANDSNFGTVSGAGSYKLNETVTITATPSDGYVFTGWQTEDGTVYSEDAVFTQRVRGDLSLTAMFMKQSGLSGVTDYSVSADKSGVRAAEGSTVQLEISNPTDENGNPVSGITAADAAWSCDTEGISVDANGLVTVGADYALPENSTAEISIGCVLNGIERTYTITAYSYAYYEKMSANSNYSGTVMTIAGRDAIVFGGSNSSYLYTLADAVTLDKPTVITISQAWSGANTCGQHRTLNLLDSSGSVIASMYYEWNGLVVNGTALAGAVVKDTWTDLIITVDTDAKTVTVTAGGSSASMSYSGTQLASIQLNAANGVPGPDLRALGISQIIIEQ